MRAEVSEGDVSEPDHQRALLAIVEALRMLAGALIDDQDYASAISRQLTEAEKALEPEKWGL